MPNSTVLDVRPQVARLTIQADAAKWVAIGTGGSRALELETLVGSERELLGWGEDQLRARQAARRERQFAEADRLREVLEERGFVVKDAPGGVVMERFS